MSINNRHTVLNIATLMTIATSRGGGHACKISDHFWPLFFGSQKVDKTGSAITCAPSSNSRGLEDIRRGWRYTYKYVTGRAKTHVTNEGRSDWPCTARLVFARPKQVSRRLNMHSKTSIQIDYELIWRKLLGLSFLMKKL